MNETLGKDPAHQTPMKYSSLLPLKRHQDDSGCFWEVPVSTVIRVSFPAALLTPFFGGMGRGAKEAKARDAIFARLYILPSLLNTDFTGLWPKRLLQ